MRKLHRYISTILQFLLKPFKWFAASFQGSDGKASGKKFTAAFLTSLTGCYSARVHDAFTLYAFIALLISILMMWGIISSNNIITLTRTLKNRKGEEGK